MIISADTLRKLKNDNDKGISLAKTDTITFQEASKRCRAYINSRDNGNSMFGNASYVDKKRETLEMIEDFVDTLDTLVDGYEKDTSELKRMLKNNIVNYGPLTDLIDVNNEDVDEIQVNTLTETFYVERGVTKRLDYKFPNSNEVKKIIEKLIEKGDRLNAENPFINARTSEGFRLNITHPSISKGGHYSLTLRKQRSKPIQDKDILNNGTVTRNMLSLMRLLPKGRVNWATVGSTGSGKTVLNNVLLPYIDAGLRCIYIENPTELRPEQLGPDGVTVINNFLQLEAKNVDDKEKPHVPSMYNLLVNALRQTPDYIVPGEVRAPKEFEVALTAAQTGHNVFTTYHAEDPEDALFRFLNAVLKISQAPAELILRDICSAFRFIVNVKRLGDGSRRVMYITEVGLPDGLNVNLTHLYKYVVDRVEEVVDERTGKLRPKYYGRHIRVNPISVWFQKKLQEEGIPQKYYEFFAEDPELLRLESEIDGLPGELLLDENGNEITLDPEVEYKDVTPVYVEGTPEYNKLLDLHNKRKLRLQAEKRRRDALRQAREDY